METTLATFLVFCSPLSIKYITNSNIGTKVDMLFGTYSSYIIIAAIIFIATYILSIIRAFRHCNDGYGIESGLTKSMILMMGCTIVLILIKKKDLYNTLLGIFSGLTDSIILALTYLLSYGILIYPFYGSC